MNLNKVLMVLFAVLVLALPIASAATLENDTDYLSISVVKINGDTADDGDILYVERGETLDIRVTVEAGNNDLENVQINSFIAGYKYNKYESDLVSDFTKTFDLPAGNKRSFDLSLEVPLDMEQKDAKLRIIVMDENSPEVIIYNYQLNIEGADESNAIQIRDFLISPSETIEAGRALSFKVKVKNIGESDLDDVTVKISIPELDITAYETIDEIESDETQSFEALLLRIPTDAKVGDYDVIATVEFDKYEEVQETKTIKVLAAESTSTPSGSESGKTVVTMPESVELTKGTSGAVYPVLIQNMGDSSKTYVLSVSGTQEWASTAFEPSSVVIVNAGSSKTVYLKLVPNTDAQAGDKVFQVSITSGADTRETAVVATIKDGNASTQTTSLKTVLEWALIILIIVLIILGLVLVFSKMRKKGKDDEEEAQTYY